MSFFEELKRRNVFKVTGAYLVVSWLLVESSGTIAPLLQLPDSTQRVILYILMIGFPLVLLWSWYFEITEDGIKRTSEVTLDASADASTEKKLNFILAGALALALGFIIWDQGTDRVTQPRPEGTGQGIAASIAVLPFEDLSPEGDQGYFADGLSEEILNVLVGVNELTVASRTSSFQFKNNKGIGLPEIAEQLNVAYVLEGSVRKSGGAIRIAGQLIEAATDRHLWSDTFDRALTPENLFAIQDEIATAIVLALSDELGLGNVSKDIDVAIATKDLTAYEAFLEGREKFINRSSFQNVVESVGLLERATEVDPEFAEAWQWLAAAAAVLPGWAETERRGHANYTKYLIKAKEAAARALFLNPNLGFARAILGFVANAQHPPDWTVAISEYNKALEVNPNDATVHLWLGNAYRSLGFFEHASDHYAQCIQISPNYPNCYSHASTNAAFQGKKDKVYEYDFRALALSPDNFATDPYDRVSAIIAAVKKDNIYAAYHLLSYWTNEDSSFPAQAWFKAIRNPAGDHSETIQAMATWLERQNLPDSAEANFYFPLGAWENVPLFEGDNANIDIWWPDITDFRKSDQFKAIVRNLHIDEYWREKGFPPQCRPLGADDFECN